MTNNYNDYPQGLESGSSSTYSEACHLESGRTAGNPQAGYPDCLKRS